MAILGDLRKGRGRGDVMFAAEEFGAMAARLSQRELFTARMSACAVCRKIMERMGYTEALGATAPSHD